MKYWLAVILALPLCAQWPAHKTPGIPRTPSGEPNPAAPAPKMADGKPDFSGLWENPRGAGGRPAAAVKAPPGQIPVATFRDVGAGFQNGLPFQPWARELQKKRASENSKYNPDALCLPMGFMQFHTHGQPRKIVQTPGLLLMIFEANSGLRQIFTDGRKLPSEDAQPWWYGYSVGRWEGDTLVVETTGLRDDGWLDIIGSPYTDKAKITERIRRPNYGTLELDITVDDPKAYTEPWTVRVNHKIMPEQELIEFICAENDTSTLHIVR